ncbi:MAG TPA: efflux transporter outer membrane subunit [Caulobacteraceae bacterium]
MRRLAPVLALRLAVAAPFLLAGCIDLAPAYHRPASPAPQRFPTGPAYAPTPATPTAIVGWREFFSDPKLKAVIEQALANNRDLRLAVANVAAARAQYHVQRAALFPTVTANATANYSQQPASVIAGGAVPPGQSSVFNERLYSLTAGFSSWQLDLFGRVRDLTRAAQEQYFATREARDEAQLLLVDEVASDYLTLRADSALLAIANETLVSTTASLDLTRHRLDAGVASALDVSQARTLAQQARYDVAHLTTQVAQDRNALELVVGGPVPDTNLPTDQASEVVVLDRLPAAISSDVLLSRPDVLQAEDALRAANANIGAARANFFPQISLTGSGGLTSLALSTLFKGSSATWSFIPEVSQTIFDAGANSGNLAFAKAQRDAATAKYEKAVQTAFREVADALAQRGTIDEQLAAQSDLTDSARQFLTLSTARYQHGADTYLNVLIAQRIFYVAQQTLVTTQLARSLNLVTLYGVLGGGLDAPQPPPSP